MDQELQKFYNKALDWLFMTGPRIVLAALVLVVGLWFIRVLRTRVKSRLYKKGVHSSLRPFLESLIFTILYIALFLLIMQLLGIRLTIFAAVIAAFGAAAGLALSGTLQNFASGVLILLLKPFQAGDNIISQGTEGTVQSIQVFYTVVKTFDNRTVIIPNSKLSNEVITNITMDGSRRLDIELEFSTAIPVSKVKQWLEDGLSSMEEILPEPRFRIGVAKINTDKYTVRLNIWINAHGFEDTRMAINEHVLELVSEKMAKMKEEQSENAKA